MRPERISRQFAAIDGERETAASRRKSSKNVSGPREAVVRRDASIPPESRENCAAAQRQERSPTPNASAKFSTSAELNASAEFGCPVGGRSDDVRRVETRFIPSRPADPDVLIQISPQVDPGGRADVMSRPAG